MGNRGEGKKAVFDCVLKLFAQGDILCQRYLFSRNLRLGVKCWLRAEFNPGVQLSRTFIRLKLRCISEKNGLINGKSCSEFL